MNATQQETNFYKRTGLAFIIIVAFAFNIVMGSNTDRTDTPEFEYQMEQSMNRYYCATKGYFDDIRCTIYLRNK